MRSLPDGECDMTHIYLSETLISTYKSIRCHNPGHHRHCCENRNVNALRYVPQLNTQLLQVCADFWTFLVKIVLFCRHFLYVEKCLHCSFLV